MAENYFKSNFGVMERTSLVTMANEQSEQHTGLFHQLIDDGLIGGAAGYAAGRNLTATIAGAVTGAAYGVLRHELLVPLFHEKHEGSVGDVIFEDVMAGGLVGYTIGDSLPAAGIGAGIGLGVGLVDQLLITPLFRK